MIITDILECKSFIGDDLLLIILRDLLNDLMRKRQNDYFLILPLANNIYYNEAQSHFHFEGETNGTKIEALESIANGVYSLCLHQETIFQKDILSERLGHFLRDMLEPEEKFLKDLIQNFYQRFKSFDFTEKEKKIKEFFQKKKAEMTIRKKAHSREVMQSLALHTPLKKKKKANKKYSENLNENTWNTTQNKHLERSSTENSFITAANSQSVERSSCCKNSTMNSKTCFGKSQHSFGNSVLGKETFNINEQSLPISPILKDTSRRYYNSVEQHPENSANPIAQYENENFWQENDEISKEDENARSLKENSSITAANSREVESSRCCQNSSMNSNTCFSTSQQHSDNSIAHEKFRSIGCQTTKRRKYAPVKYIIEEKIVKKSQRKSPKRRKSKRITKIMDILKQTRDMKAERRRTEEFQKLFKQKEGFFHCLKCQFISPSDEGVFYHIESKHLGISYSCPLCFVRYKGLNQFSTHIRFDCQALQNMFQKNNEMNDSLENDINEL